MIILSSDPDLTIQWICVGVIVVIAVYWVIKRIRLSFKHRGNSGCGCGGGNGSSSPSSDPCPTCSGCPLADNCRKPKR